MLFTDKEQKKTLFTVNMFCHHVSWTDIAIYHMPLACFLKNKETYHVTTILKF